MNIHKRLIAFLLCISLVLTPTAGIATSSSNNWWESLTAGPLAPIAFTDLQKITSYEDLKKAREVSVPILRGVTKAVTQKANLEKFALSEYAALCYTGYWIDSLDAIEPKQRALETFVDVALKALEDNKSAGLYREVLKEFLTLTSDAEFIRAKQLYGAFLSSWPQHTSPRSFAFFKYRLAIEDLLSLESLHQQNTLDILNEHLQQANVIPSILNYYWLQYGRYNTLSHTLSQPFVLEFTEGGKGLDLVAFSKLILGIPILPITEDNPLGELGRGDFGGGNYLAFLLNWAQVIKVALTYNNKEGEYGFVTILREIGLDVFEVLIRYPLLIGMSLVKGRLDLAFATLKAYGKEIYDFLNRNRKILTLIPGVGPAFFTVLNLLSIPLLLGDFLGLLWPTLETGFYWQDIKMRWKKLQNTEAFSPGYYSQIFSLLGKALSPLFAITFGSIPSFRRILENSFPAVLSVMDSIRNSPALAGLYNVLPSAQNFYNFLMYITSGLGSAASCSLYLYELLKGVTSFLKAPAPSVIAFWTTYSATVTHTFMYTRVDGGKREAFIKAQSKGLLFLIVLDLSLTLIDFGVDVFNLIKTKIKPYLPPEPTHITIPENLVDPKHRQKLMLFGRWTLDGR